MTNNGSETDAPEPATWEDMQRLQQAMHSILPELLKSTALEVGHDFVRQIDTIYQYTTVSGLRGMVEKNELWSTPVGYLNDASEYRHGQKLFVRLINEYLAMPDAGDWKTVLAYVLPDLQDVDANNVFVTCFTPVDDQLSQWRGYAGDGYGYAIGFDTTKSMTIEPAPVVLNIMYDSNMQRQFADALLRNSITEIAKALHKVGIEPTPEALAFMLSFMISIAIPAVKHPGFAEEQEVRMFLIAGYDKNAKVNLRYHERKGLFIPHIPMKWGDGKLPIREIIVGPNLDYDQARWSLDHFLKQNGHEDVEIKRSSVPYLS